jgi:hypothetical protein
VPITLTYARSLDREYDPPLWGRRVVEMFDDEGLLILGDGCGAHGAGRLALDIR